MKKSVGKTTDAVSCCATNTMAHARKCVLGVVIAVIVGFGVSFFAAKMAVQNMEVLRAGGKENFKMIMQLYKSDEWKQTQAMQIQQTMQALQSQAAGAQMPTAQPAPTQDKK